MSIAFNNISVDEIGGSGMVVRKAVRMATTMNRSLSSSFEVGDNVDGVVLKLNDRVLVKNQNNSSENGIYTVNETGSPERSIDMEDGTGISCAIVPVDDGIINKDTLWFVKTSIGESLVGTDELTFIQIGGSVIDPVKNVTLIETGEVEISKKITGSGYVGVVGNVRNSSCANFVISKSVHSRDTGSIFLTSNSPGISSLENLKLDWLSGSGIELSKTTTDHNGQYEIVNITDNVENFRGINLTGTSWSVIDSSLRGTYYVSIVPGKNLPNGPSAVFAITKNNSSIGPSISAVSNSPALGTNEILKIRWLAGSSAEISKSGNGYDGNYVVKFMFQRSSVKDVQTNLSGTSWISISEQQQKISHIICVDPDSTGPSSIFSISKNSKNIGPSVSTLANSPLGTNKIQVRCNANSGIEIRKTESDEDGLYNVVIL